MGPAAGDNVVALNLDHPDNLFALGRDLPQGEIPHIFRGTEVDTSRGIGLHRLLDRIFNGDQGIRREGRDIHINGTDLIPQMHGHRGSAGQSEDGSERR